MPVKSPKRPKAKKDPTTQYALDVVAGTIVAGRLVRLACERHLRDLKTGADRGLWFDAEEAQLTFDFFSEILCLNGGEHEGRPFLTSPWQQFILGCLFGWKRADGYRRFRTAFIEIGKGNGKSPLAGGIGCKCLVADGEARAEIYSAATKRDQAMILFRDAVAMVDQSPALAKVITKTGSAGREWNLYHDESASFFRPIASDDKSQSGPRPHCALIDEVHEHQSDAVIAMMHKGTKGRKQALIIEITNSGSNRSTVCWQHHHYSAQILDGQLEDDSWFAYVCQLDPCEKHRKEGQDQPVDNCPDCDDWRQEECWIKANPNLGVSISNTYLREQVTQAKGMPISEGLCKRLNFCIWTQVASRAIPADQWQACARSIDQTHLIGVPCCGALDIGATSDFCSYVLLFGHPDEEVIEIDDPLNPGAKKLLTRRSYSGLPYFWLPESPVKRDPHTSAMIEQWRREGFIRTTPGDLVDYGQVLRDIEEINSVFSPLKIAIDRGFQGNWIGGQLVAIYGREMVIDFPQGLLSMAAPFREFLELVKGGRFRHPSNPVFNWMAGNCAAETRGGLSKPSKDSSPEKIDGITAVVMGLGVYLRVPPDESPTLSFI